MSVETVTRFGLFDLPGLAPQDERRKVYEQNCDKIPCAKPLIAELANMCISVSVFVIDFIATRGFAREVLKEQASMERTINAVQEIASLLAGYDVEKVAELLEEHEHELPEGMTVALRALEANLRMYKAYLPKTCLPFDDDTEPSASQSTPSLCTSLSSTLSKSCYAPAQTLRPLGLSSAKVTLLLVSIKDTLRFLEEDVAGFSQLFTTLLLKTLQATESYRGMVDVFIGDRVHCSFNASKLCASHATSALHTAFTLLGKASDLESLINIGIASGTVLRGDMGCDVMRRFSMVGPLVRDVHGMERAGRFFGCNVLCNRLCFSDAECEHDLRLIPCKVEVDAGCEHEVVAELLMNDSGYHTAADEWMYMIGGKKLWDDYNQTVRKYLRGEVPASAVGAATAHGDTARNPPSVTAASVAGDVLRLHVQK